MKKFFAMLLVLSMVLALAGTAMAACPKLEKGYVRFTKDANTYAEPKDSKKNVSVVKAGSIGLCTKIRCNGKFAYVKLNEHSEVYRWFKTSALKNVEAEGIYVVWAKGGKNMSLKQKGAVVFFKGLKGKKVRVTGHTNLRKTHSLQCKSQGVVECGDKLKMTGWLGADNRPSTWIQVCYKGKKVWLSAWFADLKPYEAVIEAE